MRWQPSMGSVVRVAKNLTIKLILRPLLKVCLYIFTHPITIVLRLLQLLVLFILISILSTFFVLSYAADDYVPASYVTSKQYFVVPFYGVSKLVHSGDLESACGEAGATWVTKYWSNGEPYHYCQLGALTSNEVNGPYSCDKSKNPYYAEHSSSFSAGALDAFCSPSYSCPPSASPDYTVGPMDLNGQQVCYKRTCTSSNNWFSNSMDLGTGAACSFGCKYTVTTSYQSSVGPNAFIAKANGDSCFCPAGSTQCWLERTPNTEGDNDDTGTCYAYDMGEVKGVDCGKNGEMQVDLGPINDSLTAQGKSITDLQTNDDLQTEYIIKNTNDIAGLRVDVDALKKQGCSVTPTANGVSISCNGTSATATNGKDGANGIDGVNGAKGADGAPGEKGEKGETGATGATGAQGEKGDKGEDGQDGEAGAAGATGAQGVQGIQGVAGVAGAAGRDGIDGKDGEDGEDGEGLTAAQDGNDVGIFSASTGARLATLQGIDKDGIVTELQKSNTTLTDIDDKLEDLSKTDVTTEVDADYSDKLKPNDWESRNFGTVLQDHLSQMKQTELFQRVGAYFQVSLSGAACAPIQFDMTLMGHSITATADPFCSFQYWALIQAVVMAVAGFFAVRVAIDN